MFKNLFKKQQKEEQNNLLLSPLSGDAVPLSQVSDPTFGEEILGKGIAIYPTEGKVVAPEDGTVETMFETGHAVSLTLANKIELLIHVGLDTVALKGEGFVTHKKSGDAVKKGDLLIEFDIDVLKNAGYDIITPVVICNTADYASIDAKADQFVTTLEPIIEFK